MPQPRSDVDPADWVDRHGDALYRFALLHVGDATAAEDLVQETLVAALQAVSRFEQRSSERTWLIGILKRKIVDHVRKAARSTPESDLDVTSEYVAAHFDARGLWAGGPRKWHTDPDTLLEKREFWDVLTRCLSRLPVRLRYAFCARELGERDTEETCKLLGVTATNLWTLLHRARTRLRACLEENWFMKKKGDA